MNIELKNLKFNERLSDETNCFSASIYVDGILTAYASNRGHGGPTDIEVIRSKVEGEYADKAAQERLKAAEEYAKSLPPEKLGFGLGDLPMDLELLVDNMVADELRKRDDKKMKKKFVNSIIWGVPGGNSYTQVKISNGGTIEKMLATEHTRLTLKTWLKKYKSQFKEGEQFLNDNIPADLL